MKSINKTTYKDLFFLIGSILISLLICDGITPKFYNGVKTDRYRTTVILEKLKDSSFKPDVIVFGSSTSMMGIDGYQMSKELDKDVYNFSTTGQPPVESSLYYSMLPSSVKYVVQIIAPPIMDKGSSKETLKLNQSVVTSFSMNNYCLTKEIKVINNGYSLSELEDNIMVSSYKSRGAIVFPSLTYFLLPRDKKADIDLKFCNSYVTTRHESYERTVEQLKMERSDDKNSIIDYSQLSTLKGYSNYLYSKGIKTVFVLMPNNPDVSFLTPAQSKMIAKECKSTLNNAVVLNYMDSINDSRYFFDAGHLNKEGAKVLTTLLDKDLKSYNIK